MILVEKCQTYLGSISDAKWPAAVFTTLDIFFLLDTWVERRNIPWFQKPASSPSAGRHTASFRRPPNAFLSASICGWSAPLVSLPFICRFQRRWRHKTDKDITASARQRPLNLRAKDTLRRVEQQQQICWSLGKVSAIAGEPVRASLSLLSLSLLISACYLCLLSLNLLIFNLFVFACSPFSR